VETNLENTLGDGLTNFLCPVVSDIYYIQENRFDAKDLLLSQAKTLEIVHLTQISTVDLAQNELAMLNTIDPRHTIVRHINKILLRFKRTSFKYSRVRIEYINHNQCTLFHTDSVKLRLVQTLWGRSTEFIDRNFVNYEGIGLGRNDLIVKDLTKIQKTPEGCFLLMKGSQWKPEFQGCVHKSPEIEVHKEFRLLIVIDFNDIPFQNNSRSCHV
jgi:hypothetical protein